MNQAKNWALILEGDGIPAGYDKKALQKLSKTYRKLEERRVVRLYPIRRASHGDTHYCLYACPITGEEIDEQTLQSIKQQVDTLELGHIRYDSVQSSGYNYYIIDPVSGAHLPESGREPDAVMEISDLFDGILLFTRSVMSPKKIWQLQCSHAIVGIEKRPHEHKIVGIPDSLAGQGAALPSGQASVPAAGGEGGAFSGPRIEIQIPDGSSAPEGMSKGRTLYRLLTLLLAAGVLIWWLFFR